MNSGLLLHIKRLLIALSLFIILPAVIWAQPLPDVVDSAFHLRFINNRGIVPGNGPADNLHANYIHQTKNSLDDWYNADARSYNYNAGGAVIRDSSFSNVNNSLFLTSYTDYSYNAASRLSAWNSKTFHQDFNFFADSLKHSYTYNSSGGLLTDSAFAWQQTQGAFTCTSVYIYEYDLNNNRDKLIYRIKDTTFHNSYEILYYYDAARHDTAHTIKQWNETNHDWNNLTHYSASYDTLSRISAQVLQDWNPGNFWSNNSLFNYYYDSTGLASSVLCQIWASNTWYYSKQHSFIYDSLQRKTAHYLKSWNQGTAQWDDFIKNIISYDSLSQMRKQVISVWNHGDGQYGDSASYSYNYSNGRVITELDEYFDKNPANPVLQEQQQWFFGYYSAVTDVTDFEQALTSAISVYPNPATDIATVKLADNRFYTATLWDVSGRKVLSLLNHQPTNSFNFNTASLSKGVYLIRITDESGNESTLKLVKQ